MATVQIKRKRGQDPLEALMIKNKRSDDNLVFKLAGTFDTAIPDGDTNFTLQETSERRVFKRRKGETAKNTTAASEPQVPPQIKQMLDEYISGDVDAETEDYVYDVYFGSKNSRKELDSGSVGYIVLDEEDRLVLVHDEDEDTEAYTDDEDSNAEDFYQNDYPDEEESDFNSLDELDDLQLSDNYYSPEDD